MVVLLYLCTSLDYGGRGCIVHFALDFNPQYTKFTFPYVSLHDNSLVFLLKICRIL